MILDMRIGILSRNGLLYSTRRLVETCRQRGHQPILIDTMRAALYLSHITSRQPRPQLTPIDALIPRVGASITQYGLMVVRYYEAQGAALTATAKAISDSRDKYTSQRILSQAGLPVPQTRLIRSPQELLPAIEQCGGFPIVLKQRQGTQGRGVLLVQDLEMAQSLVTAWRSPLMHLLVQEFIPEAQGKDIRILVVGNKCVAAMERRAPVGDFRANLHQGGAGAQMEMTAALTQLALRAAKALNLAVAGIDVIQSHRGPLLLEANSSPGLEGIERVTQQDVAGHIVRHLEDQIKQRQRARRSRKRQRR